LPHIIVEGPDGSGKTTLVKKLCEILGVEPLPRLCTSEGGGVDELQRATTDWLNKATVDCIKGRIGLTSVEEFMQARIMDRFPLFSEPIYGAAIRGYMQEGFQTEWYSMTLKALLAINPLVIYCMPPEKVCVENVIRSIDEGQPQMEGVVDAMPTIYTMYQAQRAWADAMGFWVINRDYTRPDDSLQFDHLAKTYAQMRQDWSREDG
jgi:adenylate kinase family enzyme